MSAARWRPRTREDELRERIEEHRALRGRVAGEWPSDVEAPPPAPPAVINADGVHAREACAACRREVPLFELVDARQVPEHDGDWACGSCREGHARAGRITLEEWMKRLGAPAVVLRGLQEVDRQIGRGGRRT